MIDPGLSLFLVIAIAITWVVQFAQLMCLDDKSFPGAHDKPIWGFVFVLAAPLAPFAFMAWKYTYVSYKSAERDKRQADAPLPSWPGIEKPGN